MKKVRILWSGITGRTGVQSKIATKKCDYAEIVAGICRNDSNFYNYEELDKIKEEFDVIVDFSHKDSFYKVLNYALRVKKPLIIGTDGLNEEQIKAFEKAANIIPIFRGGNFRFNVKEFIDNVVVYAKNHNAELSLVETHYKTKKIPSQTAKVIAKRVLFETGKELKIESHLKYDRLINDWRIGNLHCRIYGFKQLGIDVPKIASMMIGKKADGVWDLDRLVGAENYFSEKACRMYELHKQGLPCKKVYGVVEKGGKYIVLQSGEGAKNKYQLAGGGVDAGESNIEAMKREILEELNMNVEVVRSLGFDEYSCTWRYEDKSFEVKYIAEIFLTRFTSYGKNKGFGIDGEFTPDRIKGIAEITKQEMVNNVSEFTKSGIKLD